MSLTNRDGGSLKSSLNSTTDPKSHIRRLEQNQDDNGVSWYTKDNPDLKSLLTLERVTISIFILLGSWFNHIFLRIFQLFCIYLCTLDFTLLNYDKEKHVYIKIALLFKIQESSMKTRKGHLYFKYYWENIE